MAYALARIQIGAEVESLEGMQPGGVGTIHKRLYKEIGDKVTPADLGLDGEDDPEWQGLHAEGVLSDTAPPDGWKWEDESLNTFQTRQAVEQLEAVTATGQQAKVQSGGKKSTKDEG